MLPVCLNTSMEIPKGKDCAYYRIPYVLYFYTLWQFMVHGNLPRNAFGPVIAADGNVQVLLGEIAKYVNVHGVGTALTIFAFVRLPLPLLVLDWVFWIISLISLNLRKMLKIDHS